MNESRATIAIVRRHIDRRFAFDWMMQFAIVLGLAYVFVPKFGNAALIWLAVLATTLSAEETHVRSLRRLSFFSVPLYGRQLARAHAIAPSLLALSLPLGYAAGSALRGYPLDIERFVAAVLVALVATLVALSAAFREGRDRKLYVALALGASLTIAFSYTLEPAWFRLTLALAAGEGFFALRAFGETLARYDPLPD